MTCPGFDGVTIVNKGFGQYGIPIDPYGGIEVDAEGLFIDQLSTMTVGIPEVFVGLNQIGETTVIAQCEALSKRQGSLVTFQIDWQGELAYVYGGSIIHDEIAFTLPYQARTPFKGHSSIELLVYGGVHYRRNIYIPSALITNMADQSIVIATTNSPATLADNDRLLIMGQYFVDSTATYQWG